jgi:hypothetical protein
VLFAALAFGLMAFGKLPLLVVLFGLVPLGIAVAAMFLVIGPRWRAELAATGGQSRARSSSSICIAFRPNAT